MAGTAVLDLAAHEIADSRRGHTQLLRCGSLGQTAGLDDLRHRNHEVGPGSKILGHFGREAEIPTHITRRAAGSGSHPVLLSGSRGAWSDPDARCTAEPSLSMWPVTPPIA
jgi:hypothetical protein